MTEAGSTLSSPMRMRWRALAPPPFLGRSSAQRASVRRVCSRVLWRRLSALQRIAAVLQLVLWPLAMIGTMPFHLCRFGHSVRKTAGKSLLRQGMEQLPLILRDRLAPKHYYRFRLYLPDLRQQAGSFLLRNQIDGMVYPLLHRAEASQSQPLRDKRRFAAYCGANGLPHVPTLFALKRDGRALSAMKRPGLLDETDLFLKPVSGSRGTRAERWNYLGAGRYRSPDGQELDQPVLLARIKERSRREAVLVQPALRNHPALLDLTSGALCTMRVVSWRNEAGAFEVTDAILRMPVDPGSSVDNLHAGGIAAPIDIRSGTLGRATDMGTSPEIVWHDAHPLTGARITSRQLPLWEDVIALAQRAHGIFHKHIVIGWDIALLPDGPCLIEGNESPGVGTLQRTGREPLGCSRFGALVIYHLKPYLDA